MKKNIESLQIISCIYGNQIYSGVAAYYLDFEDEDAAIEFLDSLCKNGELRKINCYNYHNKATYKLNKEHDVNCNKCPEKENCING